MEDINQINTILTVSSILFGFLSAGFWWALNRELVFDPDQRHFKFGYALLILSIGLLAYFGIILPLRSLVIIKPGLETSYRGIVLALVATYGYMLTEFGHYSVFQRPKYTTVLEWAFLLLTLIIMIGLVIKWWVI